MKKLVIVFICVLIFSEQLKAQEPTAKNTKNSFVELNFGAAFLKGDLDSVDLGLGEEGVFPGVSFLWGSTFVNQNNFVIEYEAGFALPTILTGKIGLGKKFNNTIVVAGVRPFPFNFYLQSSFTNGKRGYWIASIEYNPFNADTFLNFGTKAIFNVGYRWNVGAKKN